MLRIHPTELQRMHDGLQRAIRDHADWHRQLVRTLVCRLAPDPADLRPDAHFNCGFGRWFGHGAQQALHERPQYVAIDAGHRQLHALAAGVLLEMAGSDSISCGRFDEFMECSRRLRGDLDSLRHELAAALRSRDSLTGAYRRSELLPALHEAHELVVRGVQVACVAFMDLDVFKRVNDHYGHSLGDEVLARTARCLIDHLRAYDKVFRYGGDEFLLLLPGTGPEEAWHLVDRIRASLGDLSHGPAPDGGTLRQTASFGVTPLEPGVTVEESIERADKALLAAKAAGRDRVVCWDPDIAGGSAERAGRATAV